MATSTGLMALPRELRNRIYHFTTALDAVIIKHDIKPSTQVSIALWNLPKFVLACKQIYAEFTDQCKISKHHRINITIASDAPSGLLTATELLWADRCERLDISIRYDRVGQLSTRLSELRTNGSLSGDAKDIVAIIQQFPSAKEVNVTAIGPLTPTDGKVAFDRTIEFARPLFLAFDAIPGLERFCFVIRAFETWNHRRWVRVAKKEGVWEDPSVVVCRLAGVWVLREDYEEVLRRLRLGLL
jgi:hypothetical protein